MSAKRTTTAAERQARKDQMNKVVTKMADAVRRSIEDKTIEKLLGEHIEELDRWITEQKEPDLDRFKAVQRLIEIGLRA
ncbi:hypothetical protein [Bradyrhizobium japonicum]|uniref:hypothetical protein n=1 Tax=Bradyrhizobium japonicum TaxID=375 RepID=UPI001E652C54|nr:hypothetical protein [Bradyrhizobium japonicum]MCD9816645.1 hypothetical protein [Bradyrhizobium japonicum]MEB2670306.1 hypothetical protein [Bradyrhizobium japonicum]WRI89657.1 hypothetical protein R3F75_01470 [Bradyrhizobium japonicum]